MSRCRVKSVSFGCSLGCASLGILLIATANANAGGLAVREQSAYGQGASFAGVAAGGALSSMFWNPATMTQTPGINSESTLSGIIPSSKNTATSGSLVGTGNIAIPAIVPASYFSWQFNQSLWLGLSINAPFGLTESFPDVWAGRNYAAGGESLKTYNFTPSIAYKLNDWISVGAGVQIQYASASFTQGTALGATNQLGISGAGMGYGFTAGVTVTPTPTTTIGLGYRSGIDQKINGTLVASAGLPATTRGSVNTTVNLPDVVSLGLRQRLSSQWTALGTLEWSNWSRIGNANILQPNGTAALAANAPVIIHFQYKDGWFFSAGAEYEWNERLTLRGGIAYEESPVTDAVRVPGIPDNDRIWLSVGGTYKISPKITFDLAYSHIFVKSAPITLVDASNPTFTAGSGTYTGTVDSHVDIISVALRYRWDDPAPSPIKQRYAK